MKLDESSLSNLYAIFRRKMHEVFRTNYKSDIFGNSMVTEFNAWQNYLRDSLRLEVVDAEPGDEQCVVKCKNSKLAAKIMNPSNGGYHGNECIIVPSDLAEKVLVLGDLPDEL